MFPLITLAMMVATWALLTGGAAAGIYAMGPEYVSDLGDRVFEANEGDLFSALTTAEQGLGIGYAVLLGILTTALAVFQKAAILNTMRVRLEGGDATLMDSVRAAWARRRDLVRWSLALWFVGAVLQLLENLGRRLPLAGQIVTGITTRLLGLAWSVTSFMVIPAMIFDECGPQEGFRRSVDAIKRTWGEGLTAHISMGFAGLLAMLPFFALMTTGVVSLASMSADSGPALGLGLIGFAFFYFIVAQLIFSVARVLFTGALYRFATTGQAGDAYDLELVQGAFVPKSR